MYSGVSCSHPLFPVLKEGPPRLLLLARFHLVAHPVGSEALLEADLGCQGQRPHTGLEAKVARAAMQEILQRF